MILTISGVPGSGKTTVAKILAEKLNLKFYSMGEMRGKIAIERGITIAELNALGEKDSSTDKPVDDYQRELGKTSDNFIAEGRISWHFIPNSFKILVMCDPEEAAQRLYSINRAHADEQNDEPIYHSVEDAQEQLEKRIQSDQTRYKKYYGIEDYLNPKHYDLVIDTTHNTGPEMTSEQIIAEMKNRHLI